MKITDFSGLTSEVVGYAQEYNEGIDQKNISIVEMAINSLLGLIFLENEDNRNSAIKVLSQIADVQPGFLKGALSVLIMRYQGKDEQKSKYAAIALGEIFIGKKAAQMIKDPEVLKKIEALHTERKKLAKDEAKEREEFLKKVEATQIDLKDVSAVNEIKSIGLYYNQAVASDKKEEAYKTTVQLIADLMKWYYSDKSLFISGCVLLNKIVDPAKRQDFVEPSIQYLLKMLNQGAKDQVESAKAIFENIIHNVIDLLPPEIGQSILEEANRKQEEMRRQKAEEAEKIKAIRSKNIKIELKWTDDVQKVVNEYNDAVRSNNDKLLNGSIFKLEKLLDSKDERTKDHVGEVLKQLIVKNPQLIVGIINKLASNRKNKLAIRTLGAMIEELKKLAILPEQTIAEIEQEYAAIKEEEEKLRKQREEEYQKLQKLQIAYSGDWDEELLKFVESVNQFLIKEDVKGAKKIYDKNIDKFVFNKDENIRQQGFTYFVNTLEKYPELGAEELDKLAKLYMAEHEYHTIGVDVIGMIYERGLHEKLLKEKYPQIFERIEEEWASRKQELENEALKKKIESIVFDVTTIRIKDNWHKTIQKYTQDYNKFIKEKKMNDVILIVQKVVDIIIKEKKQDLLNDAVDLLGQIAKQNIELIAPTLMMFIKLLDAKDQALKLRVIRGLGEASVQRPGWAYEGIQSLVKVTQEDPDPEVRRAAIFEIHRVAQKEPTMLIEYIGEFINSLSKDSNEQVRRISASIFAQIAESLPQEVKEAIPALQDALHDEYKLVRIYADKALNAIRAALK